MVERGVECQHIIPQIIAVQAMLHEINDLIVKYHLADCLNKLQQHTNLDTAAYERFLAEIIFLYQPLGRNSRSYFTERN
jgi:DNA-binding FrmR family transcriptional regulator